MSTSIKKIVRRFIGICLLAAPFIVQAQKMDKPQIDKITNDTTFFTTTEKVAGNKGSLSSSAEDIEAYLSYKNGIINLHLKVELTTMDHNFFRVSSGNKVLIKLADNTVVTLSNIADEHAVREGVGPRITGRLCWTADVACNLGKEDISRMSSSVIKVIRVEADGQNLDFDVKQKGSDIITNMFLLILNSHG